MDVFSFWFILVSYSVNTFAQRCKLTQLSEHGLVLLHHVYKSFTVNSLVSCYIAKETKISYPASLKQNAGFIYAENPNRGENILKKYLGMFISLCLLNVYGYIFNIVLP